MNSDAETPHPRFLAGISTQSIRNLLPRSLSNTQHKMKKSNFSKENTPPINPNIQIENLTLNSKKPLINSISSGKLAITTIQQPEIDSSVKVIVRIRPGNWREKGDRTVRKVSPNSLSVADRSFTFDSVVDSSSTQEDVFQLVGVPLVRNTLAGYNTSILSCGQTGSGKTYTMWGPPSAMVEGHSPTSNQGIVPRIFQMLFSEIQDQENSEDKQISYQCRCSFLEIYNEQIGDLLDSTQRNLQIKDDAKNGFFVENLTEEYVTSYDDVTQILIKGLSNRKVGTTSVNSKSSRSHIVFTCIVESWCKAASSKCFTSSKTSRISLVDVAGSEPNKVDDAGRQCIMEGRYVKKSLSHLGHLVHILSEGAESDHSENIPYKRSCLTHLLKESLGGNVKLSVICCISPDEKCTGETLSTLRFGLKAKSIKNKPVENEITEDDVNDLTDRIRQLKEELIKEKSSGYNSDGCRKYFRGINARESLNQLRVSLNRSLVFPRVDSDVEEEINVDEKDVKELCDQLDYNVRSSSEENFQDACEEDVFFQDSTLEDISESNVTDSEHEEDHMGGNNNKTMSSDETCADSKVSCCITTSPPNAALKSSLSISPSRLPSFLLEPTLSESPKFENIQKKSIQTSLNLSATQNPMTGSSNFIPEGHMKSLKRSDHIRASLRSSMILSSPTESLAASLHRGLQIIDHHQRASASSGRSPLALSFEHLAVKQSQTIKKNGAAEGNTYLDRPHMTFTCSTCKAALNRPDEIRSSLTMCIVPFDETKCPEELDDHLPKVGKTMSDESYRRAELEKVCAEQAAKIEQLTLLVEQYKHEKETNSSNDGIGLTQDLEKEKHVLLEGDEMKVPSAKDELGDLKEEREALVKEIEILRNKLQSYVDVSWIESQSLQPKKSIELSEKVMEEENQRWIKKESEWICLTDELRIELDLNRRHTENVETELRLEKKVTEELDDALDRSVLGHARIVEHYADLQDKYNELADRHRRIMEGIAQVKRAAAKAGAKGKDKRFVKCLAAELSALRVEREKEREQLRKENKSLRIQLRDTAEAVHAAGELLVRLREAEEAVSVAEDKYVKAENESEKMRKQMEKQKRKHAMEMVTMKQYLAESRLPESALPPSSYWEQDHDDRRNHSPDDDQAWRAEFGPAYHEHY